jgi:predicted extracellular nuclease
LTVASVELSRYRTAFGRPSSSHEGDNELAELRTEAVRGLVELDAAIYAVSAIENQPGSRAALGDLVAALNRATHGAAFAAIDTGRLGSDDVKVALIYRADRVATVGHWAVLDDKIDPGAISTRNRAMVAQSFRDLTSAEELSVVVGDWSPKSIGCRSARPGTRETIDPDTGDGQGACNHTRVSMAQALGAWLKKFPTGSHDPDVLVVGNLNAFAREDPVQELESQGFVNLIERQLGGSAYTVVQDARAGYVDHALASPSLAAKLHRVAIWHANADHIAAATSGQSVSDHDALLVAFTQSDSPPPPVVPSSDYGGWILMFGSTLLVIWASGMAARRRRARQIMARSRL